MPCPSSVISLCADCDMEAPLPLCSALERLPTGSHLCVSLPAVTLLGFPSPLRFLFLSAGVAAPCGFLAVYQTHQPPLSPLSHPPSSLDPAHARLCLCSSGGKMLPNYRRGCSVRQEALSGAYRGGTGPLWMPLSAANPSSTPLLVCVCVCVREGEKG